VHAEHTELAELAHQVACVRLLQPALVPVRNDAAQPLLAEAANELPGVELVRGQQAVDVEVIVDVEGVGSARGRRSRS
jgi:hypothetical protein